MPRAARQVAASSIYHLTTRGSGRRRIFEDDADRERFVSLFKRSLKSEDCRAIAWCLMDNHAHLLVKGSLNDVESMMHKLCTSYAQLFNGRHGHTGHVFQGRYHSTPVETDEQLLATVRYIHLNPVSDGIADLAEYRWSSYLQYIGASGICDIENVRSMLGGVEGVVSFHDPIHGDEHIISTDGYRRRMSDAEAADIASKRFGPRFADEICAMQIDERNRALRMLVGMGLSNRQVERLTGIGRNIVQRASNRRS